MTIEPRNPDEIYTSVRDTLVSRIDKLTNFVSGSFNDQFVNSYAEQVREAELRALSAELAGYVDYAGKELTQTDLDTLGVEDVDPAEINAYMEDDQLDHLAANLGVERDQGERATGTVTIETVDDGVDIPEGFVVGTEPDSSGSFRRYRVDADDDGVIDSEAGATVSPDAGTSSVDVSVIADDVGSEYNVGSGTITYIPNPQPGVRSVTNTEPTDGGQDEQTNESLRDDVRSAIFEASGGGTASGITGYIHQNAEPEVNSVGLNEFTDVQPPYVEVVVDGGDEDDLETLIEESRPTGIEHTLVRPRLIGVGLLVHAIGDNISTKTVRDTVNSHFGAMASGDPFYWSQLLQDLLNADDNIESMPALNTYLDGLRNDRFTFDSAQDVYELTYGPLGRVRNEQHATGPDRTSFTLYYSDVDASSVTVNVISDETRETLDSSQFSVSDEDGDGADDTVVLDSSVEPDPGTVAEISYSHPNGYVDRVVGDDGTVYERGTDFEVIDDNGDGYDDAIDWSTGGSTPNDGDRVAVFYWPRRSFSGDMSVDDQSLFEINADAVDIETYTTDA